MEAVTTFLPAWRQATRVATSSMYFMIAPPKTLPRTLASEGIISLAVVISDSEGFFPRPLGMSGRPSNRNLIKVNRAPAARRTVLLVSQIPVGPMANFAYVVVEEQSKEGMVIDSGWETAPIVRAVESAGASVKYAVATHGHFDHVSTLADVARELGAKVVAHSSSPLDCDLRVGGGDRLELGGKPVEVIHTPGHTEDSVCLYDGDEVFTGDTLFIGTIGRFDGAHAKQMYESLHEVMKLPGKTVLYPGHDYGEVKSRTLAEEGESNQFLAAKDAGTFVALFS